jgi:putative ABC transport system permease protein
METLWQDLRYSLRVIAKSPSFIAVAVVALALGIGANTAIFSVVDAVLFRALPYRDARRLVWATNFIPMQGQDLVFTDVYTGWRTQNHNFEAMGAYSTSAEYTLTGAGNPDRLRGAQVTASFLPLLGVAPKLGRNFLAEEDQPSGPKAVILSDATWRSHFGADPAVVGRVIAFDGSPYTVVGVLPQGFEFLDNTPVDMLVPFQLADSSIQASNGRVMVEIRPLSVVGRLRAGATLPGAVTELNAINKRVMENLPGHIKGLGDGQVKAFSLHDHEIGNVRPALLVLLGAVGFVLLIACANVANLQLARAAAREKEVAIRGALGAGRWRLARLLLTESSAVALAGGGAGLLLAAWIIRLIHRFAPADVAHLQGARLDLRMLVFTLGVSLLTGILFGLAPVMAAFRVSLNDTLKETGAQGGTGTGTRRAQKVLMVAEIALSFVLFIGAGLLVKSFRQLTAIQPGFDPQGVLTARVALPLNEYQSVDQQRTFFQQLVERLQELPGVTSAGATASMPLRGNSMISSVKIEGQPRTEITSGNIPTVRINAATPGYFAALRIPLIEGRPLDDRDGASAPASAVVNQAFVRRYFPKDDPIGKRFSAGPGANSTIVGVVGDTKQRGLASDIMPEATSSILQMPRFNMTLVLRTTVDPLSLVSPVREQVSDLDKNLPLYGQRTHEIGVRIALGAEPQNVLRMVLNQGLRLALIGVALGLAASFALTRLMNSLLFGARPLDPETFIVVTAALVAVALGACRIPAYRATRVDPVIALRYQ